LTFWTRTKNEFTNLHDFSTTYLCETEFSAMTVLKTK
jgi:hypothetical protein